MLLTLAIQDYAVVDLLEINFSSGMTCITGETGAGKSIIMDALGLCLGDRADSQAIRLGAKQTDITASFDISANTRAKIWLSSRDLESDGECIFRRTITAEGRSRAYINGTPVTLSDCADLGQLLADIHSQHAHQSLLRRATQRNLLDAHAGAQDLILQISEAAQSWRVIQEEYNRLALKTEKSDAKRDLLEYQIAELEAISPQQDELENLEARHKSLSNAAFLIKCSNTIAEACEQQRDAVSSILQLAQDERMSSPSTKNIRELLQSAMIQLDEARVEMAQHADGVTLDPAGLQETEDRLSALHDLARKHRVKTEKLPELIENLQKEFEELSGGSDHVKSLQKKLNDTAKIWKRHAEELSERRQQAADSLGRHVMSTLGRLAMGNCVFKIALNPFKNDNPDPRGAEDIAFLIATNPGSFPSPLTKVASGGELSRISLALQVIAADTATSPTIIFDEVDVGIGGNVAEVVGDLLHTLGKRIQILVVTHQPQVAVKGNQHILVTKEEADYVSSRLTYLNDEERIAEIGRMLGGAKLTASSLAHAREMLENA